MTMAFTVLASGSSGNASLLRVGKFGLLIDIGLGPQRLAERLKRIGSSWSEVHAVLLSHVHADHWKERTLRFLRQNNIKLFCHADHEADMSRLSNAFSILRKHKLLHFYGCGEPVTLTLGLNFRALSLSHDSGMTCGFRLEGPLGSVGYATDLGKWDADLAQALADVDVLAVEFNHDVAMEKRSGRDPDLIARVLGDQGHLSNEQAADFVRAILKHSEPGRVRHLVQLHLSRQCNHPELARAAAHRVLAEQETRFTIHTAEQDHPCPTLQIGVASPVSRLLRRAARQLAVRDYQPMLPGWEE